MKIAINMKVQKGPFGGGNQFLKQLIDFSDTNGIKIVHDLNDNDIDLILMMDPRPFLSMTSFGPKDILNYKYKYPKVAVVHRINECDERKATKFMNAQIVLGNLVADASVFVSQWLKDLYAHLPMSARLSFVIHNGSDSEIFKWREKSLPTGGQKIRIVTHHFAANYMKGWEAYLEVDKLISKAEWKNKLEFHFIGNVPSGIKSENIIFHKPVSGRVLAELISENHIYITGSLNEPGSNHQIEAGLCGLPLIYINSGGIPETCHGYGAMFSIVAEIEPALTEIIKNYSQYQAQLKNFPYDGQKCVGQYIAMFKDLVSQNREQKISFLSYCFAYLQITLGFGFYRLMNMARIY
jgi:glycosyltransferase involved in cell wall biosynthesis